MKSIDRRFDAIVIGSGAAGSIAVKELTERGHGRAPARGRPRPDRGRLRPAAPEAGTGSWAWTCTCAPRPRWPASTSSLAGRSSARRRTGSSSTTAQNPYSTPRGAPYLWIRGRILGGPAEHATGACCSGCRTLDFKAASRDGHGDRLADLVRATSSPGTTGSRSSSASTATRTGSLTRRTAGTSARPCSPTSSRTSRTRSRSGGPIDKSISWRYAAPEPRPRAARASLAARETGRLTTRTDAVVSADHRRRPHGARRRARSSSTG